MGRKGIDTEWRLMRQRQRCPSGDPLRIMTYIEIACLLPNFMLFRYGAQNSGAVVEVHRKFV
jgi:hypothetical protein